MPSLVKQHQYTGVTKMAAASQMIDGLVCTDTGILNWKGDAAASQMIDGLVCTDTGILNWKGDAAVQALGCR